MTSSSMKQMWGDKCGKLDNIYLMRESGACTATPSADTMVMDALSCRLFFAKEPLIIGLFCGDALSSRSFFICKNAGHALPHHPLIQGGEVP